MRAKLEEQARTALQEAPYKYHNAMKWLATNYTEGFSKREEKVRSACLNIAEQEEAPYLPRKSRAHTSLLEEDQDACSLLKSWLGHTFDYYWKVGRLLCSLQVLWPCLLVTGCCVVAIHVVDSEGLSDEEYDISQRSQGEWSAVLSKPSIDLGSETHEMLALVLGFLLAFQAQEAADRYVTADATFQKMCASLQEAALHSFSNLKNTKVTRAAKVHWELARSLHLLLLVASRDLQTGSLKGRRLTSKETDKTLGLLDGFVPEQASAIASTTGMARVYMSFEWVRMILDCAADKKWMDPDSAANKALECLDNFLEQWKEAHILAHAGEPALFHGLMSLFLYIFCCTLPFPLAASLGVWCFPAAITLAVAFFSLKVASDKMMEPFGFDDGTDVDVEKYCKEFWGIMQEMVVCVGWTPQRQKPIPWGCNKIKREVDPGEKMNGPPGEHELSCIIAESLGEKFAIKEEQVQEACRRMSARQSM
ncbi:Splicing factor 3B subunit 4 [Durusdinium trenchii]|uniref:Splicing factor 3B subunit 4 n=1 Tax=Durusdinium trenchii TaxID=1381693 RepID=A0ABP0I6C8_9DINO